MNKQRRLQIVRIINAISNCAADRPWLENELNRLLAEEEDALDSIPESFQGGERFEICEESVELLSSAIDEIDSCYEDDGDYSEVANLLGMINGI